MENIFTGFASPLLLLCHFYFSFIYGTITGEQGLRKTCVTLTTVTGKGDAIFGFFITSGRRVQHLLGLHLACFVSSFFKTVIGLCTSAMFFGLYLSFVHSIYVAINGQGGSNLCK